MSHSAQSTPPIDPFVESTVERALAPYRGVVSAEALASMRVYLEDVLLSHPLGMTLVQRARPREARAASEETPRDELAADLARAKPGAKGAGGGSK